MKKYIIESGDTISSIAKANGISQKKLLAANKAISDASDIKAGDQLIIPAKIEDPATQAALNQSNTPIDNPVRSCPLQAEWLTIKPLRYAVAEDDSEINLAEDLTLNSNLPALTQHKYITRQLSDQVVYLYHPEEKYLLQVVYFDGKAEGQCLFGEPSQEVTAALPLLKQSKGSKVIMWLTQSPLTQARVDLLQANPDLIEKAGQKIDFAKAAKDQQEDTFPLFGVKKYLAELASNVTSLLDWSANPLETSADENSFIGDYQIATPDNNYGVCLVDAIGITTDLCREFSIAYEMVMTDITTTQHPFQMAKLTRAIIDREANKANKANKAPEMDEGRLRVLFGTFPSPELTQSLIVSRFSDEKKTRIFEEKGAEHEESFQQYLNDYKKDVAAQAEKNAQEKKSELEELIHKDKMDALLDKQPNAAKEQKKILEGLAEDWVSWIKDNKGSLDLALTWLDDADEKQLLLKETLVAASINNINAFDKGVAIVAEWVDSLSTQLSEEDTRATISGVGAHYFITMGFGTVVLTGSKWLKAINGLVSSVRTEIEKAHAALMFKMRATPPTEVLLDTISAHLVKMGTTTPEGQALWKKTFDNMSRRYGMQFATVTAKLDDVAFDLKASYTAVSAVTFNQVLREEARSVVRSSTKIVNLIDLEQAGAPGDPFIRDQAKYPRFLAKHMNALELYGKNLKAVYAKSDKIFASASQAKLVGIFAFAQLFNTIKLYDAMEQDTSFKAKADFYSALFGLSTASMALVDKVFSKSFAGQSFTGYMKTTGAMAVGNKTTALLNKTKPLEILKLSDAKQTSFYEYIGTKAGKLVNGAFRALPVLGALVATFSTSVKLWDDVGKQNTMTVALSTLSLVANGGSAVFFIVGFLFSGPVLIVLATALGILAIALDFWRGMVADDQAKLLLKSSYWGKSDYKYQEKISSWEDRSQLFSGDASEEEEQKKIVKTMGRELQAFCDYLYKPVAQVVEQSKVGALSVFTIKIELPNFVKGQSNVIFAISGDSSYTQDSVLLATNSEDNRWQMNNLKGGLTIENNTGLLTLEIDERTLTSHREKRIQTGQASRNNSTKGMNYMKYNLSLEYKQPAGIPINLKYPKITIDDNKFALSFWRNQTEIEDFYLEQAAL